MMRPPLRMAALVRKEMIQYFRDPIMLFLVIYLYTGEVIMCSSALSFDVRDLPTVWADLDGSAPSRLLSERFESSGYFRIVHRVTREEEMKALLDRGAAAVAVVIPPDFSRHLAAGSPAAVQVLLDGSNANSASVAQGYAQRIVREFSLEALDDHAAAHAAPRIEHRPRIWYNSELRSVYSIVLSMIGLAGMLVGVITAAASIVREKESGTIEQIRVTPVTGPELIVAKMLPTLLLGLVSLVPALLIAGWYGVPLRGSLFLFFLFSAVLLWPAWASAS
ncbi:MAG TPA: ABC transporter permease [Burkholderiales bacterium]